MANKIVIDASVIVSAFFGGNPQKALTLAFTKCKVFSCDKIKMELMSLPEKLSSKLTAEQKKDIKDYLKNLTANMNEIKTVRVLNICRDPKDNIYLEACYSVKANILLTRDKDLLVISKNDLKKAGLSYLQILTPEEFLDKF